MKIKWSLLVIEILVALALLYGASQVLKSKPTYPDITTPKPPLGNPNATLLVEEYSDFQCPFCKAAEPSVKQMLQEFGKKIRFEYKNYPIINKHPYALKAAEAAECANDQGKFWQYHDILFSHQEGDGLKVSNLRTYADQLLLDMDKFNACLDSDAKKDQILLEAREAEQRGLTQTPTFFINGKIVTDWAYLNLRSEIINASR